LELADPRAGVIGVRASDAGGIGMIFGDEVLQAKAELMEVANALNLLSFFLE
jgi:hypothetical protein